MRLGKYTNANRSAKVIRHEILKVREGETSLYVLRLTKSCVHRVWRKGRGGHRNTEEDMQGIKMQDSKYY